MSGGAHFLHFLMTLLTGFLWLPIWVICAISYGNVRRKEERRMQERQLAALEELARVQKYRGWMNDK